MTAGELLRTARWRGRLTQEELARLMGTTQSAIARWESETVSPRFENFRRALNACGFEPRVLLVRSFDADRDQIAARLELTPKQRLDYLTEIVAFEERARGARPTRRVIRSKAAARRLKGPAALPTLRALREKIVRRQRRPRGGRRSAPAIP